MLKVALVVDDSEVTRKLLIRMMRKCGFLFIPIEANNGNEALEKFSPWGIHLVLCDWSMPIMDGLQLVQEIRIRDPSMQVPIVMFTAESHTSSVKRALGLGIQDYVIKPFTEELVHLKLGRYLDTHI